VSAGKDTACTLLLDISSSMNGRAIGLCRQLALVFTEALDVLGFPTEVIGFSTVEMDLKPEAVQETGLSEDELMKRYARFAPLYHAIYKEFDEPWRKVAGRIGRMNSQVLTPLGESLLFAGKRLLARPEKRKVLFCLTDGKPVVGTWNEQVTLDHACQAVERLSSAGIEPIGIGILEACVQEIFPSHAVIHDLSELPRGFMTELCKALRQKAPLPRRTETPATVVST
jgi:cobalamin biosynthesis protein CobT